MNKNLLLFIIAAIWVVAPDPLPVAIDDVIAALVAIGNLKNI